LNIDHEHWMRTALEEARAAGAAGEVPVGAVLVDGAGQVAARGRNGVIALNDPTAHAEILAIRNGAASAGNYRLLNSFLYVTVEPCLMCMGAIVHARISTLIFGAPDPRWGAAGSLYDFSADPRLNHRVSVIGGVCETACRELIQSFFRDRRRQARIGSTPDT
jgi:tRNA(adenine34) deaminase